MTGIYDHYDSFFLKFPDLQGARAGGLSRAKTARRVNGKFAPNDPDQPFEVDENSHHRAAQRGGEKRRAQVTMLGLRDEKGRFIKLEEE